MLKDFRQRWQQCVHLTLFWRVWNKLQTKLNFTPDKRDPRIDVDWISIRHASDRYLIDIDPRAFGIWDKVFDIKHSLRVCCGLFRLHCICYLVLVEVWLINQCSQDLFHWRRDKSVLIAIVPMHYSDVIMGAMASQATSLTIVYSTVYSGADQRIYQRSSSLAFVRGVHQWPVNSPQK